MAILRTPIGAFCGTVEPPWLISLQWAFEEHRHSLRARNAVVESTQYVPSNSDDGCAEFLSIYRVS